MYPPHCHLCPPVGNIRTMYPYVHARSYSHTRTHIHTYPYTHTHTHTLASKSPKLAQFPSAKFEAKRKTREKGGKKGRKESMPDSHHDRPPHASNEAPGDACACTSSPRFHPRARLRFARGAWKPRWRLSARGKFGPTPFGTERERPAGRSFSRPLERRRHSATTANPRVAGRLSHGCPAEPTGIPRILR